MTESAVDDVDDFGYALQCTARKANSRRHTLVGETVWLSGVVHQQAAAGTEGVPKRDSRAA